LKKYSPYFIIGLVVLAIIFLSLSGKIKEEKHLNERITFNKRHKIPYGMFAAYNSLKSVFPNATVSASRKEPGYWDSLSEYKQKQALIIVAPEFKPDVYEMKNLLRFIENGNSVFISTISISYDAGKLLKCEINGSSRLMYYLYHGEEPDTLTLTLANPPYNGNELYTYPGKQFDSYFSSIDSSVATVLGYNDHHSPDFIRLKAGDGNLFLHLAPMTFCNYFLLYKNNLTYYENILSQIPSSTTRVVWDEYYITKRSNEERNNRSNWLSVFFRYPALKWALITALLTLLIYVLLEMRRKQRYIPVMTRPRNDSLDFVKTIGRLYHDKGDHKNLCRKMAAYFLEYVRNKYKLPTSELNDEFIRHLKFKSGAEETEIRSIISFIKEMDQLPAVSDRQLTVFHKQLENFYQYS
jgi:Domain of unknown function (DUF4350)